MLTGSVHRVSLKFGDVCETKSSLTSEQRLPQLNFRITIGGYKFCSQSFEKQAIIKPEEHTVSHGLFLCKASAGQIH